MIAQDEADQGFDALRSGVGGLAEDLADLAAIAIPDEKRLELARTFASFGRDIVTLAEAGIVLLERAQPNPKTDD
jgi:hypothetical protein